MPYAPSPCCSCSAYIRRMHVHWVSSTMAEAQVARTVPSIHSTPISVQLHAPPAQTARTAWPLQESASTAFSGETPSGGPNCTACPSHTYSPGYRVCLDCATDCGVCDTGNGECLGCNPGEEFFNNSCRACSGNTFSLGGNVTSCQTCNCPTCSVTTGDCTSCSAGFEIINGSCEGCTGNRFSAGGAGSCTFCDSTCTTCDSSTGNCLSCSSGHEVNGLVCSPCGSGSFSDGTGNCQTCDASCLTCDATSG